VPMRISVNPMSVPYVTAAIVCGSDSNFWALLNHCRWLVSWLSPPHLLIGLDEKG
jgi:hypothetical protein